MDELILSLSGIEEKRNKWDHYIFNGIGVPRVSDILSSTISKDYLKTWAAKLGKMYEYESNRILDTGSMAHEMIEDFLLKGYIKDSYNYPNADSIQAHKAYENFIAFWNDMKSKGYTINVLFIEKVLTCPYYGGTCDCIAEIIKPDGTKGNYILDFKTSKTIDFSYFLQTILYQDAVNYNILNGNTELPHIDGVGVIRVDKDKSKYEYMIADNGEDFTFLNSVREAAINMVNWYYYLQSVQYEYKTFRKEYFKRGY